MSLHLTTFRSGGGSGALYLKQQGWYQRDIATAMGVCEETVSRWLARERDSGPEALRTQPRPGHPAKLSASQMRMVPEVPLARC